MFLNATLKCDDCSLLLLKLLIHKHWLFNYAGIKIFGNHPGIYIIILI